MPPLVLVGDVGEICCFFAGGGIIAASFIGTSWLSVVGVVGCDDSAPLVLLFACGGGEGGGGGMSVPSKELAKLNVFAVGISSGLKFTGAILTLD